MYVCMHAPVCSASMGMCMIWSGWWGDTYELPTNAEWYETGKVHMYIILFANNVSV